MFGFNFFSPMTGETLKEDSADALKSALDDHYQVKNVRKTYGNKYDVTLKDGHHMTVSVDKKFSLFNGEQPFISFIDD